MTHKVLISLGRESFSNVSVDFEGTADEAIQEGKRLLSVVSGNNGLDTKTFNAVLDEYLTTGTIVNGGDIYETMSDTQKLVVNEIKKSKKRTQ